MTEREEILGVDLGTTNTVAALMIQGQLRLVENREGQKLTPSMLYLPTMDDRTVGSRAKHMRVAQPDYCCGRFKPFMEEGDATAVFTHPDSGDRLTAVDASTHMLGYIVECAEDCFNIKVVKLVIGVPAHFGQDARDATKQAGLNLGVEEVQLRNEPTMAIRAQSHAGSRNPQGWVGVFDVGGGTFDLTVCHVTPEGITVSATDGHHRLGGEDFTLAIYNYIREQFKEEHGIEFDPADPEDGAYLQDLWDRAEKMKLDLSSLEETMTSCMAKGEQVTVELSRHKFEDLNSDNTDEVYEKAENAIAESDVEPGELDSIFLVGGASRMPVITDIAKDVTGGEVPVYGGSERDLAVAKGCGIEAARWQGKPSHWIRAEARKVQDVTSLSLGVACCRVGDPDPDRQVVYQLIPKGEELPAEGSAEFGLAVQGEASPDEVIEDGQLVVTEGEHNEEYREELKIQVFSLKGIKPGNNPQDKKVRVEAKVDKSGIATLRCTDLETGEEIEKEIDRNLSDKGE